MSTKSDDTVNSQLSDEELEEISGGRTPITIWYDSSRTRGENVSCRFHFIKQSYFEYCFLHGGCQWYMRRIPDIINDGKCRSCDSSDVVEINNTP